MQIKHEKLIAVIQWVAVTTNSEPFSLASPEKKEKNISPDSNINVGPEHSPLRIFRLQTT